MVKTNKLFKSFLVILSIIMCIFLYGCFDNNDYISDTSSDTSQKTDTSNDTTQTTDTSSDVSSEDTQTKDSEQINDTDDIQGYFVATVNHSDTIDYWLYTGNKTVSGELEGILYSSDTPGGKPRNDGTGKMWIVLKPEKNLFLFKINIDGEYSSMENIEGDLYCIHGVKSDLEITVTTKTMLQVDREMFAGCGYGISDGGKMIVSWEENESEPLRYVEISYTDEGGSKTQYVDAKNKKAELFTMTENQIYTVSLRAIGYKRMGKTVEVKGCYMNEPKKVAFPRVEITTENYIWPSCDYVGSPDGCWGAGITNAFYEQCTVTIFNENNETVYTSSLKTDENEDYLDAKIKIRGNTSARYASNGRYPYKIKLSEKADLLKQLTGRETDSDIYEDKNWLLLNYGNDGYRICGDAIADAVGTEWSPDYCYVCRYVNGEYRGLYVLSESVKEGSGNEEEKWRVNVDEDGYVFECDAYWWNEDFSFATPLTENTPMHFTLKYPDPDNLTDNSQEVQYLKDYITRFEEALMKDGDSYLDYIDLDSFVKWLLVSDYLSIKDGGGCNIFLYKKDATDNTKLCMGPNWDFDSYMGDTYGLCIIRLSWDTAPFYYQYLIKIDSFMERYRELFKETYSKLNEYVENAFSQIDEEAHYQLLTYDNKRFGTSLKTLSTRKTTFLNWLNTHVEWMKTQFDN